MTISGTTLRSATRCLPTIGVIVRPFARIVRAPKLMRDGAFRATSLQNVCDKIILKIYPIISRVCQALHVLTYPNPKVLVLRN